ncbi:MAG: tRNA pseudouridine(13) synthase TruD [Helicobacteraceae bacterium]|nr:tRNA pseudouridine(13) synthase TruD [Helicobacteraceae bacterium]
MKRYYTNNYPSAKFSFNQNRDSFKVEELTTSVESEKGSHLVIKIQKRNISTIEMLDILEDYTECQRIGYAGLKDKSAQTIQYISLPLKFSKRLNGFSHPQMSILETYLSKDAIKIGDLKANKFTITLEKVNQKNADIIEEMMNEIMRNGMPNYFGYQRFGKDSDSFEKCRDIAHEEITLRDKKMQKLLTSSYQSYLFNDWLVERVKLSEDLVTLENSELKKLYNFNDEQIELLQNQAGRFKVLNGDIMQDMKTTKWINVTDLQSIRKPYKEQKLLPTGLLCGGKIWRSKEDALRFEEKYDDKTVNASGDRRLAWIFPKQIRHKYVPTEKLYELSFTLPRGAYATTLLEYLAKNELSR